MLDLALISSATLMGLAATPHCAAMCSAPCALACKGARQQAGFQVGRVLGYAAGGALATVSAQLLAEVSQSATLLQPVWALLQAALLALGLSLLWRGRAPLWLGALQWRPQGRHVMLTGMAWVAMPCGLLHAALLLAALSNTVLGGALAMTGFALASSLGLLVAPLLTARLRGRGGDAAPALRLAGLGMATASAWALVEGVWRRSLLLC
ncbi:MAG: sulfite exporter TauE/SafE family protein [Roseateles depolymerans]|uniref:Sulfite exporter TauE/SafE family protein n=1 Tax=Roseateles depolymerans TaxID=76731 RepID=A0A2W5FU64_9BURK|nr:MAG: sulfite exporter TauE/SafE family protein [Roseateles depolymerans]